MMRQENIRQQLKKQKLLFDGAFGTYYAQVYDTKELPELANTLYPDRVKRIHEEYVEAGAQMIRTNTFAANTVSLDMSWEKVQENIRQGFRIAQHVAQMRETYVAADIGQIPYDNQAEKETISRQYVDICRT